MTLEHVGQVDWSAFAQPADNVPDTVPRALRRLASVATDEEGITEYHAFLFAVGNNHAGTYCPVVVPTIQFLGEILMAPADAPAAAVMEVLTDLATSFEPEPEHAHIVVAGDRVALREVLAAELRTLVHILDGVAADERRPPSLRAMAADLRQVL